MMYIVDMSEESLSESSLEKSQNGSSSRAPKCRRCRNHNVLSDLRGHKHQCKFKDCMCSKCVIVTDGQRQTAVRIALYRQQRNCENEMKHNSQSFENGVEGNGVWNGSMDDEKSLENGYSKRKYHQSSDSGSNSPGSDMSCLAQGTKRFALDSPPTIQDGACAPNLPMPQEVLTRAFPHHSAMVLDLVLKGCNGNVLHAIEIILQYDKLPRTTSMAPFIPPIPVGSEPSNIPPSNNLLLPLYKFNGMNGNFRYLVPPGMLPLSSYMFPGGASPFGCVPPPGSFPAMATEDSQHVIHNGQPESERDEITNGLSPKIEKEDDDNKEREKKRGKASNGVENGVSQCHLCGHVIHIGDRFCTNCRYSN